MSLTQAIMVLAAVILVAATIVATSLGSSFKSIVDSLDRILDELQWQQNGTGTKMQRRIEKDRQEQQQLENELPNLAALSLLPHQKPLQMPQKDQARANSSAPSPPMGSDPSSAQSIPWRVGRLLARLRR
jgi:hypothetical protein